MIRCKTILLGALAVILSSCNSIKEDRSDCPCLLTLEFSHVSTKVKDDGILVLVTDGNGNILVNRTFEREDYDPDGEKVSFTVPKGNVEIAAIGGAQHITTSVKSMSITLPSGNEADSLFLHTRKMVCKGETAVDTVDVHKQWCTLTLVLKSMSGESSYGFSLEGGWNGTSLADFSPTEGIFDCEPRRIDYNILQARIPRQGDDSLILGLSETDSKGNGGVSICDIPIGEMVSQTGYDWSMKDLDDLTIAVDYSEQEGWFAVRDWDDGSGSDKVI